MLEQFVFATVKKSKLDVNPPDFQIAGLGIGKMSDLHPILLRRQRRFAFFAAASARNESTSAGVYA